MAVEEAGTLDTEKIIRVLESGKNFQTPFGVTGIYGGKKFYGHSHQWYAPQYILEVKDGNVVPIDVISIDELKHGWD